RSGQPALVSLEVGQVEVGAATQEGEQAQDDAHQEADQVEVGPRHAGRLPFLGEQAALALCAQLVNMVPEMETKFCLAGQIIDEARHVEVFGRYLEKLGVHAPINRPLEELIHRLLESDHYGEKIVGMQIFLEGIAVGIFQRFQTDSPDPLMRDILRL